MVLLHAHVLVVDMASDILQSVETAATMETVFWMLVRLLVFTKTKLDCDRRVGLGDLLIEILVAERPGAAIEFTFNQVQLLGARRIS